MDPRTKQPGESDADVAQRLLLHPMWEGATDSEVAFDGKVPVDVVREQRAVMLASIEAQHVARSIGWTGSPHDLILAALRSYSLARNVTAPEVAPTAPTFLSLLADQGVTCVLLEDGHRFVTEPKSTLLPNDVRDFIMANIAAIRAELQARSA
jgi:ABC-type uncharacterized transport system YnjBCD permease subunit